MDHSCQTVYEDAVLYDHEFESRVQDMPFYRRWAKGAAGDVLEVACGTGRLTLPIAEEGVSITGIDMSEPMLSRAKKKARDKALSVVWHLMDCRHMKFDKSFTLIFMAANAMQHLLDLDSLHSFLASARRHLCPKGVFIVEVFNPILSKLIRRRDIVYEHKKFTLPDGDVVLVTAASEYYADKQLLEIILRYYRGGVEFHRKHVEMRCFFPEELMALCQHNKLRVIHRFGDYDERKFEADSRRQILVCQTF